MGGEEVRYVLANCRWLDAADCKGVIPIVVNESIKRGMDGAAEHRPLWG